MSVRPGGNFCGGGGSIGQSFGDDQMLLIGAEGNSQPQAAAALGKVVGSRAAPGIRGDCLVGIEDGEGDVQLLVARGRKGVVNLLAGGIQQMIGAGIDRRGSRRPA